MSKYAALGQGILTAGSALQGAVGDIVQSRQNQSWLELQREQMRQAKARQDREEAERNLRLELELAPMLSGARSFMEEYGKEPWEKELERPVAATPQAAEPLGNFTAELTPYRGRDVTKDLPDLATLRSLGPEGTTAREKVFGLNAQRAQRQAQAAQEDAARKALAESDVLAELLRPAGIPDDVIAQIAGSGVGATAPLASIAGRLITAKSRKEIADRKPAGGGGGGSAREKLLLEKAKAAGFFRLPAKERPQAIAKLRGTDPEMAAFLSRLPEGPGDTPQAGADPALKSKEWVLRERLRNALENRDEKLAAEIEAQLAQLYAAPSAPSATSMVDEVVGEGASPSPMTYDPSAGRLRNIPVPPAPPPPPIRQPWTKTRY